MTLRSALRASNDLFKNFNTADYYCLPLGIDAALPKSELPSDIYEMVGAEMRSPGASYNRMISTILRNFFHVEPIEGEANPVAKFDTFADSPQDYFRYEPYDPTIHPFNKLLAKGISPSQLRLREMLVQAGKKACTVLFSEQDNGEWGEHTKALRVMDDHDGDFYSALFAVTHFGEIKDRHLYSANDLAGIQVQAAMEHAPLPTVFRDRFPDGQRSWELIILPPDPAL